MRIERIISGGQTGADRAALDVALAFGIPSGGWVPRDRAAEDGVIPDSYPNLRRTETSSPEERTELNVREADATLILSHGPLHGGSAYTKAMAEQYAKPVLHVDLSRSDLEAAVEIVLEWLRPLDGKTLNVAGPRESEDSRIYLATRLVLAGVLNTSRPRNPTSETQGSS